MTQPTPHHNQNRAQRNGAAVAIGNFDGFHLGHKKLTDTLKRIAAERNLDSMIMTFSPNPKIFFNKKLQLIHSDEQKRRIFDELGVDRVNFLDFAEIRDVGAEDFVTDILIRGFDVRYIVMGENFRFGKNRAGDMRLLQRMSSEHGFGFSVVTPVVLDGTIISSSLIRKKLAEADIPEANRMLGRAYYIEGTVVRGEQVGRELGFPTINVLTDNEILPHGVFQTRTRLDDRLLESITYIGSRPTFSGNKKSVETHIFDFDEDVYDKNVRVYFERKLRNEIRFDSKTRLIEQIKKDIRRLNVDKEMFF